MRRNLCPLLGALLAVVLLGPAAPAWAHTRLVSSTPAEGAPAQAPSEVVLAFSDPVQAGLSAVSVVGADGEERAAGTPAATGDGASVSQALRAPLEPGTYRVAYRVLAADGHPVTGSLEITAIAAAPAPAVTPTAAAPPPEPAPTSLRPAAGTREEDGGLPLLPLAVGGLLVAGAAGLLARRVGGAPPGA